MGIATESTVRRHAFPANLPSDTRVQNSGTDTCVGTSWVAISFFNSEVIQIQTFHRGICSGGNKSFNTSIHSRLQIDRKLARDLNAKHIPIVLSVVMTVSAGLVSGMKFSLI